MKTYTITEEQLNNIEHALTLAQYFIDDQESSHQTLVDQETHDLAIQSIKEVKQ